MREPPVNAFSPRAARLLAAGALASLLAAFALLLFPGEGPGIRDTGAHGYSRSAIGHLGLIRLLRDVGEPVLQLRRARDLDECGLLVLAEPRDVRRADDRQVKRWIGQVPAVLLVLPKRTGETSRSNPRWLGDAGLVATTVAEQVLQDLERWTLRSVGSLQRADTANGWKAAWDLPVPTLVAPVQLLRDEYRSCEPLVDCDAGVLLGRIGNVFVLSDPDVLANHGLGRGDNAAFAVGMLRALRGHGAADGAEAGAIVFDETLHGHAVEPSIWQVAGQFPHVLVPAHLLLLLALVLWVAHGRFGAPLPEGRAIGAGKRFLIDNVAALLARGAHHGPSLRRYGRQRVRAVAERLHAPRGLSDEQCRAWLLQRIPDPDRRERLRDLLSRAGGDVPARDAVANAREVRTLTEELSHGGL